MNQQRIKTEYLTFDGPGQLSIDASQLDVFEILITNAGSLTAYILPQGFSELPGSPAVATEILGIELAPRAILRLNAGIPIPRADEYVIKFRSGAGTRRLNVFLYGVPKC